MDVPRLLENVSDASNNAREPEHFPGRLHRRTPRLHAEQFLCQGQSTGKFHTSGK